MIKSKIQQKTTYIFYYGLLLYKADNRPLVLMTAKELLMRRVWHGIHPQLWTIAVSPAAHKKQLQWTPLEEKNVLKGPLGEERGEGVTLITRGS